jgi:transcriptional regulator with XRE-family HTH domain
MGLQPRRRPRRLAVKLLTIRTVFGLTQDGMARRLGEGLTQNRVSDYERGRFEPPLAVLLSYARLAGICPELLMDDRLDLPSRLPPAKKHKP